MMSVVLLLDNEYENTPSCCLYRDINCISYLRNKGMRVVLLIVIISIAHTIPNQYLIMAPTEAVNSL